MPIYEYRCPEGHVSERVNSIASYKSRVCCPECPQMAERVFLTAPRVVGDYEAYDCPITGKRIEGRKEHEANLRLHGCRVLEPGETERATQFRKQQDTALDSAVERTAEEFVAGLDTKAKEQLAVEMDSGLTAVAVRQ